jgi:hypothetical protein
MGYLKDMKKQRASLKRNGKDTGEISARIALYEKDLEQFECLLNDLDEADICTAIKSEDKNITTLHDYKEMTGGQIEVNGDFVNIKDVEADSDCNTINIVMEGYFIPEYIIDMIKENRIEEVKHYLEKVGI